MCVGARYKQNTATEAIAMYLCPDGGSRDGDPDWARTSSLQLRRLTLYPIELRGHKLTNRPILTFLVQRVKRCRPVAPPDAPTRPLGPRRGPYAPASIG
jgi:uncharacterized protein YlaI